MGRASRMAMSADMHVSKAGRTPPKPLEKRWCNLTSSHSCKPLSSTFPFLPPLSELGLVPILPFSCSSSSYVRCFSTALHSQPLVKRQPLKHTHSSGEEVEALSLDYSFHNLLLQLPLNEPSVTGPDTRDFYDEIVCGPVRDLGTSTQTFIETKTDGLWRPKVNPGQTGGLTETEDRNQG